MESLTDLPEEILLLILSFLPIPDLLQCTRVCHLLRSLATDSVLHSRRLLLARYSLQHALSSRKTKASISPPNAWIWLTRAYMLSRSVGKNLVKIRLKHNLERRPSTKELVARAILPSCTTSVSPAIIQSQRAVYRNRLKDTLCRKLERRPSMSSLVSSNIIPPECVGHSVSPSFIETRRKVIRESLKDGLRAWVENRGLKAQRTRTAELNESERITVKLLVRRFRAREMAEETNNQTDSSSLKRRRMQARFGRALEVQKMKEERTSMLRGPDCVHPTRAHVLDLKRWWEGLPTTST